MRVTAQAAVPSPTRRAWIAAGLGGWLLPSAALQSQRAGSSLMLRFGLGFENPTGRVLVDQQLWMYLPLQRTSAFTFGAIETSLPHALATDRLGQSILHVSGLTLTSYAQRIAIVSVALYPAAGATEVPPDTLPADWLQPQRFVESDDAAIVATARHLRADDDMETARRIHHFVSTELRYAGYVAEDLGAAYALRERRGDCTEYAALVVALCRAIGIPARMVGGYVSDRSFVPAAKNYHDWAEVQLAGRWRVVDAQKGAFLDNEAAYLGFRYHWDRAINGVGLAHRYRVEGEMVVSI